jgi:hypothetical protein
VQFLLVLPLNIADKSKVVDGSLSVIKFFFFDSACDILISDSICVYLTIYNNVGRFFYNVLFLLGKYSLCENPGKILLRGGG